MNSTIIFKMYRFYCKKYNLKQADFKNYKEWLQSYEMVQK